MAVGKVNKRGGIKLKASQKKYTDPFTRKHWFDVIAPSFAKNRFFTKICSNKDTPSKLAAESLRGRIVHVNTRLLNAKNPHTKMMGLRVGDVFGKTCVTYFNYCKNIVTKQFPKRNTTLITAFEDVKTVDGFTLRVKVCGVTGKQFKQLKATCYANNRQQRAIREMMQRVVRDELSKRTLNEVADCLISETLEALIRKQSMQIYSLADVSVFKTKVIQAPVMDATLLLNHHGGAEGYKASISSNFKLSDFNAPTTGAAQEGGKVSGQQTTTAAAASGEEKEDRGATLEWQ